MESNVTAFFTSCGRWELLAWTLHSFNHYNTYPIDRYIVIDNSVSGTKPIETILDGLYNPVPYLVLSNPENIGQVASIDRGYAEINTEYIFHCEDDWRCLGEAFLEKSLDLLKFDDKIVNINNRVRFDEEESSRHPVGELKETSNGTKYHEYVQGFHEIWHGFSWNPGLRRKSDYDLIKPFKQYANEQGVGAKYYDLGFKSACLEECYFYHIGKGQHTFRRNE